MEALDDGKVKENFDGAMFDELNEAGIGVVVRNPQGEIIAAPSEKMPKPSSVVLLESLAARRATYFVLELGFQDSIFKGDSEISIKVLQTGIPPSTSYVHLIKDICLMLALFGVFPSLTRLDKKIL